MEYKKIIVELIPYNEMVAEVMMAQMGEYGFESFCETEMGFEGYVPSKVFDAECMKNVDTLVENVTFTWSEEVVPDQDWNKEWEENFFKPIVVDDRCLVRSSFHEREVDTEYEIIINPQMAFGTGHHETTCLMIRFILEQNFAGCNVLDMGCGTGILGILTSMKGAERVLGVDIDDWCYNNTKDNLVLNNITNMEARVGDASILGNCGMTFDTILANINRNILLVDMDKYVNVLKENGKLVMSGFYQEDKAIIADKANQLGLVKLSEKVENNWTAMLFVKK